MAFFVIFITLLWTSVLGKPQFYGTTSGGYNNQNFIPAPIGIDGRVIDTPEVAQAKAAHLAAHQARISIYPYFQQKQHPSSIIQGNYNGYYQEPVGFNRYSSPFNYGGHGYTNFGQFNRIPHAIGFGYHGPPAPLARDGRVLDTPEVSNAKAAHFAAFNEAASRLPYSSGPSSYEENYDSESRQRDVGPSNKNNNKDENNEDGDDGEQYNSYEKSPIGYNGPPAPIGQDGRVVDTPEVASAKAAHLAAYARAANIGHYHQPVFSGHPFFTGY